MNDNSETVLDETPPATVFVANQRDVLGMTDKGYARTKNEDHFLIVRAGRALETVLTSLTETETMPGELFEETAYGIVVADGVGGESAGEIASRQGHLYAAESIVAHSRLAVSLGTKRKKCGDVAHEGSIPSCEHGFAA